MIMAVVYDIDQVMMGSIAVVDCTDLVTKI